MYTDYLLRGLYIELRQPDFRILQVGIKKLFFKFVFIKIIIKNICIFIIFGFIYVCKLGEVFVSRFIFFYSKINFIYVYTAVGTVEYSTTQFDLKIIIDYLN